MRGDAIETTVGIVVAIVIGVIAVAGFALKGVFWLAKKVFHPDAESVPTSLDGELSEKAPVATRLEVAAVVAQPVTEHKSVTAVEVPLVVGPSTAYKLKTVADFHVNVQFSDSFSASVSVHKAEKVARRKIRAISQAAGELMRALYLRESFDLPDVKLEDGVSYEDAILDTETVGMRFIEELLSKKSPQYFNVTPPPVIVGAGLNDVSKPVTVDPEATARALAILRGEIAGSEGQKNAVVRKDLDQQPQHANVRVEQKPKRAARAITVGRVLEFGLRTMLFQSNSKGNSGNPGTTFEVLIECDGGDCVSLRGVRLQELFQENGVRVGDVLEIISLGRTQVTLDGGESKFRNEFEMKLLERA